MTRRSLKGTGRWSAIAAVLSIALLGCGQEREREEPNDRSSGELGQESAPAGEPQFRERAADVGLDFVHFNGMTGERYFSEHMGGGAALLDFDRDGDLDLFVTQGQIIEPGKNAAEATPPWKGEGLPRDRLLRNDLEEGVLRFTDVTAASAIAGDEYAVGVSVGDIDNDGLPDLFVSQWNAPDRLYRNAGEGRFEDVTEGAGVGSPEWSLSSVFVDYDRDGWLDLYVATYTAFSLPLHKACRTYAGALDYCGPQAFRALPDRLYRNLGDGTFADVSSEVGIAGVRGSGLGVVSLDANDDGWPDLYVANDQMPNRLWLNDGGVRFEDAALLSGTAVNADGHPEAGMGIAVGDVDRDGQEDLLVTHLDRETHTLYRRAAPTPGSQAPSFFDATAESGLGSASFSSTGFGAGWLDYDNDGWLDLFVANGAVKFLESLVRVGDPYPMHQPNQLFRNTGAAAFVDTTAESGREIEHSEVSRGAAFGDLDNDGDTDIVVVNNAGPLRVLINEVGQTSSWIGFYPVLEEGRPALGARVTLVSAPVKESTRWVRRGGSYASSSDPRVLFGLGALPTTGTARPLEAVEVRWPDGRVEQWRELERGRYHRLVEGQGQGAVEDKVEETVP